MLNAIIKRRNINYITSPSITKMVSKTLHMEVTNFLFSGKNFSDYWPKSAKEPLYECAISIGAPRNLSDI